MGRKRKGFFLSFSLLFFIILFSAYFFLSFRYFFPVSRIRDPCLFFPFVLASRDKVITFSFSFPSAAAAAALIIKNRASTEQSTTEKSATSRRRQEPEGKGNIPTYLRTHIHTHAHTIFMPVFTKHSHFS